jgi:hypothetical protein
MRREDLGSPLPTTEQVEVAGLGEVTVRSLRLSEFLPIATTADQRRAELSLVATAVVDEEGRSLWTEEQWDVWAGAHLAAWQGLARAVARVVGLDAQALEGN